MFKKGQAAMEFLMTYGWAILVVLAAIGALAYFGVLSPDNLLPERTSFQAPIPNIDNAYITNAGTIEIAFSNNNPNTIEVHATGATMSSTFEVGGTAVDCSAGTAVNVDGAAANLNVSSNKNVRVMWTCGSGTWTTGMRVKGTLGFEYKNIYTGQVRVASGSINGKVA